jgi:outer membrane receptor protein involved in Fe transport
MTRHRSGAGAAFLAAALAFAFVSPARADDPPPPAGGTDEKKDEEKKKEETPAAPVVRPRPQDPPPPQSEFPAWDLNTKARGVGLPPPLPPPDRFAERPMPFRHDTDVSADGRLKEVRRVPQWVDVLDRAAIEDWRPQDLGEMLRRFPNVMIADGGSPYLRMPVIRALGGDRVKILTDGVWPAGQALGVAGGTLSLWDAETTERVEVYHGPGAYLRGADAGGGVINVVPRRPHRHECFEAWGEASSSYWSADDRFREHVGADFGRDRLAALVGVTYEDRGNLHTPDGTLDPATLHSFAASAAVDWFLDNQSTVGLTGQYVKAEDIRSPLENGGAFAQPKYERTFLALTFTSFDVGPVFHGTRFSLALDSFVKEDDQESSSTLGLASEDSVDRFDLHLQGNLYLLPCHDTWAELTVGYAHIKRTESILCRDIYDDLPGPPRDVASVTPQAVPGQCVTGTTSFEAEEWVVQGLIEDEWHDACNDFHLGARVDWYHLEDDRTGDSRDDVTFGVAGGIAHHWTDCLTTYANASYAHRHPTIEERLAVSVLDGVTVFGNPDLDDETSVNVEVGVKRTVDDRDTLQAALFVHWLGDFIGRVPVGTDEIWDNEGDVFTYGFELAGAHRFDPCACEGFEAFGSTGITLSDDQSIVHDLPWHARAGMRYSTCREPRCGVRRWFVEAAFRGEADWESSIDDGDSYLTADVLGGVGWQFAGRRTLTGTLGVTNLFDAEYTEPLARLPAPGIAVIASLAVEF